MTTPDEVLAFWFGPGAPGIWFTKDPAFDAEARARFGDAVELAASGALVAWADDPRGALALVVLLDQLPRNLFRASSRAFAQDARALAVCLRALDGGAERGLSWLERYLLRMPLMHAEDVTAQRRGVASFTALADEAAAAGAPAQTVATLRGAQDYARRHAEIVERFGRFPHRNAVLGRASTEEERAFLTQPGSSF